MGWKVGILIAKIGLLESPGSVFHGYLYVRVYIYNTQNDLKIILKVSQSGVMSYHKTM